MKKYTTKNLAVSSQEIDVYTIYVYPDGEQYREIQKWKQNDYVVRQTKSCRVCCEELKVDYDAPFASCKCGTMEWYR